MAERMKTYVLVITEDDRSDVKGGSFHMGDPVLVKFNDCTHRLDHEVGIDLRKSDTLGGTVETVRILIRTEHLDLSVCRAVCLQTFEYFQRVVKRGAGRAQRQRSVRYDAGIMPSLVDIPGH